MRNFAAMKSIRTLLSLHTATPEARTAIIPDLFFCVVLMPLLVLLGPSYTWISQWPLFFILACAYLYACYFIILSARIPTLLLQRRYGKILVVTVGLIAGTWLLSGYPLPEMDFVTPVLSRYQTELRDFGVSVTLWLMFSLVVGYSVSVAFVKELYAQLLLKRKIEAERDRAELAVFKAQISPHFLFNTLNSLYSLVIGTSERAEEAFVKFTGILKYTYTAVGKDWVTIGEEVENIENYISLQAIRLNRHTKVEWECHIDDDSLKVPPMIIVTFVENAYKYGASTSKDCVIRIGLEVSEGVLTFTTRNRVMKQADVFREEVPVGIENCRSRLDALYPGSYELDMKERDGEYELYLKMKRDE